LNAKGPNSFMSRLKIEKSVVLSESSAINESFKEIQFDYGLRAEQSENRNDLALLNTIQNLK
jgi:hypothetical protein